MGRGTVNQGPKGFTVSARREECSKRKCCIFFAVGGLSHRTTALRARQNPWSLRVVPPSKGPKEQCESDAFSVLKRPPTALFMQEMQFSPRLGTKYPDKAPRTERGADAKESIRRQRGGAYDPGCFSAPIEPHEWKSVALERDNGSGAFARKRRLERMPCRLLSPYALPRPE